MNIQQRESAVNPDIGLLAEARERIQHLKTLAGFLTWAGKDFFSRYSITEINAIGWRIQNHVDYLSKNLGFEEDVNTEEIDTFIQDEMVDLRNVYEAAREKNLTALAVVLRKTLAEVEALVEKEKRNFSI